MQVIFRSYNDLFLNVEQKKEELLTASIRITGIKFQRFKIIKAAIFGMII